MFDYVNNLTYRNILVSLISDNQRLKIISFQSENQQN